MLFRVSRAVFVEAAYIGGESKQSVSTRAASGGVSAPATVEAIVGTENGLFIRHRGRWAFVGSANVKSADLEDVPVEVQALVAPVADAPPGVYLRPVAAEPPRIRRSGGRGLVPVADLRSQEAARAAQAVPAVAPEDAALLDLIDHGVSQETVPGTRIICGGCGAAFEQGANHWCQKPAERD